MSKFEACIDDILKHEGGFVNNVFDQGGVTNLGVTQATLANFRGHAVSVDDVKNLTVLEAKEIYKKNYWDAMRLDEVMDVRVAAVLFDAAVNRGVGTVVKQIQASFVGLPADGKTGPKTLAAINAMHPVRFIVEFFKDSQLAYVSICVKNPSQLVFLRGWLKRTHDMLEKLF